MVHISTSDRTVETYVKRAPLRRRSDHHTAGRIPLLAVLTALLLTAGCSRPKPVHVTRPLPENVIAHPPERNVIITRPGPTPLPIALRALGIPFERLTIHEDSAFTVPETPVIILDEEALVDEAVAEQYPRLVRWAKGGGTLIILRQDPRTMQSLRAPSGMDVIPREVTYTIRLFPAREGLPLLSYPNGITRADLDSFAIDIHHLASGGREARAIIAGNTIRPDSSAALLAEPFGSGNVWYVGFPIAARAAFGYPAEQKLLANIMTALGPKRHL